jgi:hypothetical protein
VIVFEMERARMALRTPQKPATETRFETGQSALDRELKAESAANLGRTGREIEVALAALADCSPLIAQEPRKHLVKIAARAVWRYFVQREAMGLVNHNQAIAHYAIPPEVLARVGVLD